MSKVIVALDGMNEENALELARQLRGAVWGFKVNDLLVQSGMGVVTALKQFGGVFADPKFYDIPNTVGNSVRCLVDAGADLITVHASGGKAMLEAAAASAGEARILAVTVLTSFSEEETKSNFGSSSEEAVSALARRAVEAGVQGMVCSPQELTYVADLPLLKVTPGVRPVWYKKADDQSRVKTPAAAIKDGADYLVIGRPITAHEDPLEAARLIADELA